MQFHRDGSIVSAIITLSNEKDYVACLALAQFLDTYVALFVLKGFLTKPQKVKLLAGDVKPAEVGGGTEFMDGTVYRPAQGGGILFGGQRLHPGLQVVVVWNDFEFSFKALRESFR